MYRPFLLYDAFIAKRTMNRVCMPYTEESLEKLDHEFQKVLNRVTHITAQFLTEISPNLKNVSAKEYLEHGVCRRIRVLERSIERIYELFPPNRRDKLTRDELADVQINLHAFVINLFGVLDNLAWVYVLEHSTEHAVGGRKGVGLYTKKTQEILPPNLKEYLNRDSTKKWYESYVKNYRDALAHRIPLYIPPLILTDMEAKKWNELDDRKWQCIKNHKFSELEAIEHEIQSLGSVCDFFSHSLSENESNTIYIHAQVLADGATVLELCDIYFKDFWIAHGNS